MPYSYLALGDSYTIGESVLPEENFPHQAVALLSAKHIDLAEPLIIARTGWTTDELDSAIDAASISGRYDFVSLLIGVNNQYRGRAVSEYKVQFDHLLQRALQFANNKTSHVFVLSIPDWGVTPFAEGQDRKAIGIAIDGYNNTAKDICAQHHILFIDITTAQRADSDASGFVAPDGLHPSAKEYKKWAKLLAEAMEMVVSRK